MRTLFEDGLVKAAQGLTTLDELLRIVSPGEEHVETVVKAPSAETILPAAPAPSAVSGTATVNVSEPAGVRDGVQGTVRRRVLVVEDSPTTASVVKYFLELEGSEVLLAADGLAGLETAQREHPQVIVSDVNMPGMGGVEMVKALRGDARTAQIRIMMLTSESSVEAETEEIGRASCRERV